MRLGLGHGLDVGYRPELFGVPLLDTYSGAAAAYSLRKLRTGVTSVVRVRRSSDNAEADFAAAEVTNGTLTTWTGANDGFVVTWYDQSGNGRNATQATAASQPKLVNAGALITEGSLPCLEFDGTDDRLQYDFTPDVSQPFTIFNVRRYRSNGTFCAVGVDNSFGSGYADINISGVFRSYYGVYLGAIAQNTTRAIWYSLANGASSEAQLNGTLVSGDAGAVQGLDLLTIGAAFSSFFAPINTQELIIYTSNKSADRDAIEAAINSHYSIY